MESRLYWHADQGKMERERGRGWEGVREREGELWSTDIKGWKGKYST